MPTRDYRLVVEGELSDDMGAMFEGITHVRERGNTVFAGPVRDPTELQGLLKTLSALGLTLLEARTPRSRWMGAVWISVRSDARGCAHGEGDPRTTVRFGGPI